MRGEGVARMASSQGQEWAGCPAPFLPRSDQHAPSGVPSARWAQRRCARVCLQPRCCPASPRRACLIDEEHAGHDLGLALLPPLCHLAVYLLPDLQRWWMEDIRAASDMGWG